MKADTAFDVSSPRELVSICAMDPKGRKINANNNKSDARDISINTTESGSESTKTEIADVLGKSDKRVTDAIDGPSDNGVREELILLDELNDGSDERSNSNVDPDMRKLIMLLLAGKKTAAQGMMDVALITANASQLRYVLEHNRGSHTYHLTVTLLGLSLFLQVAVGMLLICKGMYRFKGESKSANAKRINTYVLLCVFLITIVNVIICGFSTMENSNVTANPVITRT